MFSNWPTLWLCELLFILRHSYLITLSCFCATSSREQDNGLASHFKQCETILRAYEA